MQKAKAISQGLEIEPFYYDLDQCINNMGAIKNDIFTMYGVTRDAAQTEQGTLTYTDQNSGEEVVVTEKEAFLELMHAVSDFSPNFKGCYEDTDHAFYRLYMFFSHYDSMRNYMLNLIPNMLSYALFFNTWSERIQFLEKEGGNEMELLYVYAVIIRKLFLYDYIPDALNDDLDPVEFGSDSDWANLAVKLPAQLEEVHRGQDEEGKDFIDSYWSYSKLFAVSVWQAMQELAGQSA